ncbi:MAG TPA: SRPBCC domain-containing protein [Terracidiphilus sp.]|jgi:uncharacterized protein YndB with AHSA1/START domain
MKTVFLSAVLAVACVSSPAARALQTEVPNKVLKIELSIPAPLHDVWAAFTTNKGLSSWLAPDVSVDLKPGGDWLVKFPGSTGGGTIESFVREKELVIRALAPDRFPAVRAARTRVAFTFEAAGDGTLVTLTQTGWQKGAEWDAAYEYLAAGNAQLMAMLHHRFVAGPTDWQKAMGGSGGGAANGSDKAAEGEKR